MILKSLKNTLFTIILTVVILNTRCIEPYFFNESSFENAFVAEGMITNDPGPYKIFLSRTTSATDPESSPYTGATIKIMDDTGFTETLSQIEPGTFMTDTFGIRGTIGRKYKIVIETNDGKKYESMYSELKEAVPIDDFYCEYELNHDIVTSTDSEGYRFYAEFQPYIDKNTYLMWLSEETFQYEAPFSIDYIWIGYFHPFENPDTFKTCWTTRDVREVNTLNNDPLRNQQSITVTLNHTELKKFAIQYSLLLKQLSVDEKTNEYWKAVNDINEGQNSFYNQQPYQIKGNIRNVDDPDEIVLGYFFAAGISKKRIFQSHLGLQTSYYCYPDFRAMRFIYRMPESTWPIWIVDYMNSGALGQGDESCFDCRMKGGTITEPDFWE